MKINREQRFREFCAALDVYCAETPEADPSKMTVYAISMAVFGKKPGGDFYAFHENWLKLRQVGPGAPLVDMPAEAAADLESWTDQLKAQIMQRVTGIVRGVAGSFEQTAAMRVNALEGLCAEQSKRYEAVIATLLETEAELDEAKKGIAALTHDLEQEHDNVQRLLGRLEEREALLKALTPVATRSGGSSLASPDEGADNAPADDGLDGERQTYSDATEAALAPVSAVPAAVNDPKQTSVVVTNQPVLSQGEMPLVAGSDAEEAQIDEDDNG